MNGNPYLEALETVPPGETRSFQELAALAGRPGAARAAGRALAQCPRDAKLPWHRAVTASGEPRSDAEREALQWRRLRREGARPRAGESIASWAKRRRVPFVGNYRSREYAPAAKPPPGWRPEQVEPLASEADALARGFRRAGERARGPEPLPEPSFVQRGAKTSGRTMAERIEAVDWERAREHLARKGYVRLEALVSPSECSAILLESTETRRFDRSVDMLSKGYGVGSYHYYREPLPAPAGELRRALYRELAPLANDLWPRVEAPPSLEQFWTRCRAQGQKRPSSILICYGAGGINHPHRDIYGSVWFPFQALLMLARRGRDFEGGELFLMDELPGPPSVAIPVSEGDVVIFASRERIERSSGRRRRLGVRHGMKTLKRGKRYGLGIVFHLAE